MYLSIIESKNINHGICIKLKKKIEVVLYSLVFFFLNLSDPINYLNFGKNYLKQKLKIAIQKENKIKICCNLTNMVVVILCTVNVTIRYGRFFEDD